MKTLRMAILLAFMLGLLNTTGAWAIVSGWPSGDAYVDVNEPDTNYNANALEVSASGTSCEPTSYTYMQWDLTGINPALITTATLTLTVTGQLNAVGASLTLYETTDGWDETTLTANNAPAVGAQIETQPVPNVGQVVTFNSTALRDYVKNQANADAVVSFVLRFSSGCVQGLTVAVFADRENTTPSHRPYLLIQGPNAVKVSALGALGFIVQWPTIGLLVLAVGGSLVRRMASGERRKANERG